jgi:hypothetical protein
MHPGDAIALPDFVMTVLEVGSDGRPAVALLRADSPLDAGALRWMAWTDGKPTPLELPRVGESRTLAPASWRFD